MSRRTAATLPLLGLLGLLAAAASAAQYPVNEDGYQLIPVEDPAVGSAAGSDEPGLLSPTELEALVGPIALYPDDLLAIVLPASTYPLEIVQAARFLEQLESDSSLKPDQEWDDSVVALLNYPEVVELMNEDLDWTWRLGEAVVAQQQDVIAAIESFRDRAYTAGNLKSDEYQTVTRKDRLIEIRPVREEVIYVPYYEPERVVVYSPRPVYHYYPTPYPLYYYPYASDYSFASGYFWGLTTAFSIGWASDYLYVHHHSYHGHPYYGRHYYGHHYRRPPIHVHHHYYVNHHRHRPYDRHRHGDYWRPRHRGGARPGRHVARSGYYRDGYGDRHFGGRDRRDQRAADRRRHATPRDTLPRTGRRGDDDRRFGGTGHRGRTPFTAPQRSPDRPRNRSGRSPRERPAVVFRPRPGNGRAGFGPPRHEPGRSKPPAGPATRSTQPRRNLDALRPGARKPALTPRVAGPPRSGPRKPTVTPRVAMPPRAASQPPRRPVRSRSSQAGDGHRSSVVPNTPRTVYRGANRQSRARVNAAPPPRAAARSQPRTAFSGRSAAVQRPAVPSQRRAPAPSRPPAHRSSSGRSSAAQFSSPRRGGRSASAPSHRGGNARGPSRSERRR